ncbi:uncharacterized mitochondrial protein AtMg00310-like [Mercurialis annua]|uniref:uncharacterized mitochondrial protein AtMg00310-like n=1 Tax=Mercurialis annua TaxID=3986 RepID=UPI00215E532B|nr:uncharacterized mitochondrial protein AtMg00310-like [Mercurialis annua]
MAQSIPNYIKNVFLISLRLCEELERTLCISKKYGGMGFKKVRDFNIAMLARQAWRLIKLENNLMVRIFKANYFPKSSFLEARLG